VYVQPYPDLDRRWAISVNGGTDAVWALDGSEIFFRSGTRMSSVSIGYDPEFTPGQEVPLFESLLWFDPFGDQSYDVMAGGEAFVAFRTVRDQEPRIRVSTALEAMLRDGR
jgi:hypothetical protein